MYQKGDNVAIMSGQNHLQFQLSLMTGRFNSQIGALCSTLYWPLGEKLSAASSKSLQCQSNWKSHCNQESPYWPIGEEYHWASKVCRRAAVILHRISMITILTFNTFKSNSNIHFSYELTNVYQLLFISVKKIKPQGLVVNLHCILCLLPTFCS